MDKEIEAFRREVADWRGDQRRGGRGYPASWPCCWTGSMSAGSDGHRDGRHRPRCRLTHRSENSTSPYHR